MAFSFLLASCQVLTETLVEGAIQDGISNAHKSNPTSTHNTKAQEKEKAQLIKDGKCPVCRGMGRSADGKYICTTCNGTGKYTETNNKQE